MDLTELDTQMVRLTRSQRAFDEVLKQKEQLQEQLTQVAFDHSLHCMPTVSYVGMQCMICCHGRSAVITQLKVMSIARKLAWTQGKLSWSYMQRRSLTPLAAFCQPAYHITPDDLLAVLVLLLPVPRQPVH